MAKKKEQKDMAQEQEQRLNFQQKLIEILELGKKKKNMLEYQEIADFFKDLNLDPEKFEMVIDYLEQNGIDVLKISNDDDVDDDIILDDEDEVEVENANSRSRAPAPRRACLRAPRTKTGSDTAKNTRSRVRANFAKTTDKPANIIKKWSIIVGDNSCSENLVYGRANVTLFVPLLR